MIGCRILIHGVNFLKYLPTVRAVGQVVSWVKLAYPLFLVIIMCWLNFVKLTRIIPVIPLTRVVLHLFW
jgi:hypothetical protein